MNVFEYNAYLINCIKKIYIIIFKNIQCIFLYTQTICTKICICFWITIGIKFYRRISTLAKDLAYQIPIVMRSSL